MDAMLAGYQQRETRSVEENDVHTSSRLSSIKHVMLGQKLSNGRDSSVCQVTNSSIFYPCFAKKA